MSQTNAAPIREKERIQFLDALRGFALLGILLMNIAAQSQPDVYYNLMNTRQPITGPNLWAWVLERGFFEGTMRGLFSILFGAGTILLLNRLVKQKQGLEPADIYYRRMLWLLVFGLINAFVFLWPGDILYPYALCGLLLFPFRNWSPRNLLWGAFFFLAVGTYRGNSDLFENKKIIAKGETIEQLAAKKVTLNEQQQEDLNKYKGLKEKRSQAGIEKQAAKDEKNIKGQGYINIFKYYRDKNMEIESTDLYNGGIWDILLFFFLGMALFKSGYLTGKKSNYLYAVVAIVGITIGLLIQYYYLKLFYYNRFDGVEITKQNLFAGYQIRRVFQTMGYLSTLILLYKLIPFRKVFNILIPVGQMAFTNYLSQSIITSIIFYGFGLYATLQRYQIYYVVVAIWIFQIIFSTIWLRYYRFGPFEWVWRSLTYWKKQPMRRTSVADEKEEETTIPGVAAIGSLKGGQVFKDLFSFLIVLSRYFAFLMLSFFLLQLWMAL